MEKTLFITCVEEDAAWIKKIQKWITKGRLDENIVLKAVNEDPTIGDYDSCKRYLLHTIRAAEMLVVLMSDAEHHLPWLEAIVELSKVFRKKLYIMRIPFTDQELPECLAPYKEIAFNPNAIEKYLNEPEKRN